MTSVLADQTDFIECIVVGAGVIGLAVARELSGSGHDVLLVDAESDIGTQTSSRNSEVIHAGIYYPEDSEKAALCLPGKQQLYDYCEQRGVPVKQCGKLIVATTNDQKAELEAIFHAGQVNGVSDLSLLTQSQTLARASELSTVGSIWSPSSGIVDSHQLMLALLGDFENTGGTVSLNTRVHKMAVARDEMTVLLESDGLMELKTSMLVNCAGLGAIPIAKKMDGLDQAFVPGIEYAKGSYFAYSGRHAFNCLVYPVPTPGGLGTHLTLDMSGQARFGPDVEWVHDENYDVPVSKLDGFYHAVRDYWPAIDKAKLTPAYAGIRAKCKPSGKDYTDFIFSGPNEHGVPGLVNLFGMESPGLTSCLAIAEKVKALLNG
ncbi:MAG: NAD(P)/FAD-dependent oxidoreductase [Kordiimonadaceae bacterium]|nr:NAD(P)/FAD-dependent oxidoreductase [Kordiimonadaceae bacterium]MBO6570265.1 NAD(P)/FAD-dependent oxidoreductase [Kordiimonadaceae bacterium]MBO6965637.1 NAD(P)/FAD-dependent oxidoreductase [Kordiimonadaceae bacterium]